MDLDPFVPVGIEAPTMRFLDMFLLHCLLTDSPPDTPQEIAALGRNQQRVAARGREPGLMLERGDGGGQPGRLGRADRRRVRAARRGARRGARRQRLPRRAARGAWRGLGDADTLPSARVLATMRNDFDNSYVRFTRAQSEQTRNTLLGLPWTAGAAAAFRGLGGRVGAGAAAHRSRRHHALRDLPAGVPVAAAAGHLSRRRAPAAAARCPARQTIRSFGAVILRIGS